MVLFLLSGCAQKTFKLSPNLQSKIQSHKKITVSLVRPDTHIVNINLNKTKENLKASQQASKIFKDIFQKSFGEYFTVHHTINDQCPLIDDNSTAKRTKECSELLTMLKKPLLRNPNDTKEAAYDISKLPHKDDVTVYLYAVEPTRSAGEVTKDLIITTTLMALTGMAPVAVYSDTITITIIDNKTGKMLWKDFSSGASLDIDDKEEMLKQFNQFKENFEKYYLKKR